MVLSTHAVIGAAVAQMFPTHPFVGFTLGFVSHFVADAVPHWHYQVGSVVKEQGSNKTIDMEIGSAQFLVDILKIGTDGMLGLAVAFICFGTSQPLLLSATMAGALGGMLPDALQFAYWKWKHEPLSTLQRFHHWIHATKDLDDMPLRGPALQVVIALACIAWVRFL